LSHEQNAPKRALKPIVFILKAMSAPSRSWKGPAPELVNVMHELFDLFNSNYWILVFALPGMSRDDALGVVSNIICKATIEKGKGAMSKGAQIMRGALDALLNPADLSFAPVTPSELLVSIHQLVTKEEGKAATSQAMAAIDYCLTTELNERFPPGVLQTTMDELLTAAASIASISTTTTTSNSKEDTGVGGGAINPAQISKLLLRLVIQSVRLHPSMKAYSILRVGRLADMKVWATNKPLWKGCLHLLPMFGEESYPTYLRLPKAVLEEIFGKNVKLGKSLSAHVKVGMDVDEKAKYESATIGMVESWKA
jgi:hypothetical protein